MKPTVGRIVHYTNLGDRDGKYRPEIQAAIITKVVDGYKGGDEGGPPAPLATDEARFAVSLHIFYPTGQFDIADVKFAGESAAGNEGARGKWQWPAREVS